MAELTSYLYRLTNEAVALMWRAAPDYEAHLTSEGCLVLTGEPVADANCLAIWGGPAPEERLREFGGRILSRDLPCVMFTSVEQSECLAPFAREFGFNHVGTFPMMVFEPKSNLSRRDDYATEIVTDEAGRADWASLFSRAFGISLDVVNRNWGTAVLDGPGLTIFTARQAGVAMSTVTTIRAGATVGIYTMGTPAEHQRKGAGAAVLAHAINHHRATGAKLFYLIATEQGQPLYRKVGFWTIADVPVWVRGHSTQAPG